jgi:hypothetical protein
MEEASEGVHPLVQTLAESRLKYQSLQRGRPGSDQELGLLVGQVRRRLFLVAVDCLLAKVGPGNTKLAKKRTWAILEDQRMARECLRQVEGLHKDGLNSSYIIFASIFFLIPATESFVQLSSDELANLTEYLPLLITEQPYVTIFFVNIL